MAKALVPSYSQAIQDLAAADKDRQNEAFQTLSTMTAGPVDWAYDVWDNLLRLAHSGDNRQRSIAGQILCNLAQSDPEQRILRDIKVLLALTRDERFVTARHCLLALWKVAVCGRRQRKTVVDGLVQRFKECASEKNGTLIRYDIQCVLRTIYDQTGDTELRSAAETLIELEQDPKYRKKYQSAWRSASVPPARK